MDKDKVQDVFGQLPDAALALGYGLLEATPLVVAAVLRAGDGELVGDPIGRPLMNMRARAPLPLLSSRGAIFQPHGSCVLLKTRMPAEANTTFSALHGMALALLC